MRCKKNVYKKILLILKQGRILVIGRPKITLKNLKIKLIYNSRKLRLIYFFIFFYLENESANYNLILLENIKNENRYFICVMPVTLPHTTNRFTTYLGRYYRYVHII